MLMYIHLDTRRERKTGNLGRILNSLDSSAARSRVYRVNKSMERERSAEPRDPYKGVTVALLAASALGTVVAVAGGLWLGDLVVLAAAIPLGLALPVPGRLAFDRAYRSRGARARPG